MRLIDADNLNARLSRNATPYFTVPDIENAPTVDAVPVVRCENCHYATWAAWADKYSCGQVQGLLVFGDHFCAFGRRKEEGKEDNRSEAPLSPP